VEVPELPGELLIGALVDDRGLPRTVVDLHLDAGDGRAPCGAVDAVLAVGDRDPRRDRFEEGLAYRGAGPDGGAVAAGNLADREVTLGLERALEARVDHLDAGEPLHVGNAEPARGDEPQGSAVRRGERVAVHLVAEEVRRIRRLGPGHAPGEGRLCLELAHLVAQAADVLDGLLALIGAVEDDLDSGRLAAGLLEHGGQRGAAPAGVANRA